MQVTKQQQEQAEKFRLLFQEAIRPFTQMPLMLSGGVDSATNLAAILSLGLKPPHCYTFRLGERESSDAQVSRRMCQYFAISHTVVSIPQTEEVLIADISRVLRIMKKPRKVHVQVCQPFLYLAEAAHSDGYAQASFAMAADDLWGSHRAFAAYVKAEGEQWFRDKRERYIHWEGGSDDSTVKTALACGVQLHDPWRHPKVVEFLLDRTWNDLHTPKSKGLALRAFPEFWQAGAWFRENSSLQVNAGVREWHDTLLQSPLHNPTEAKMVVVLYRRWFQNIEKETNEHSLISFSEV